MQWRESGWTADGCRLWSVSSKIARRDRLRDRDEDGSRQQGTWFERRTYAHFRQSSGYEKQEERCGRDGGPDGERLRLERREESNSHHCGGAAEKDPPPRVHPERNENEDEGLDARALADGEPRCERARKNEEADGDCE